MAKSEILVPKIDFFIAIIIFALQRKQKAKFLGTGKS